MFTDIERSTRLLSEIGSERYADILGEHHEVILSAVERHGGREVDTQGDGVFAAFDSARGAAAAAREIQHSLPRLRVRIGLHTGEALVRDGRYVGLDVHEAARVGAIACGGQVLLTASTADVLEPGAELRDLGLHRLRDIPSPVHLFQLGRDRFPVPATQLGSTLPVPATTFVGREREIGDLARLLRRPDRRLVTLAGPGGVGKTRLAIEVATRVVGDFPAGTWWIPLAGISVSHAVLPALAEAMRLPEGADVPLREAIAARLGCSQALLVLDNCEHLLPDVAHDIAWLRDLAGPTVLATSRERLRVEGEHVVSVLPLDGADAVELLVGRAAALGVALERSPQSHQLCDRLDRLPLAVELAAGRTPLFDVGELLDRIGERLDLLRASVDVDPRQQTLRATIAWSYDLLDERERRLLRALSVFADGCTYETSVAVCGAEPDTLQSLLDKSLVQRSPGDSGIHRFRLLDTVRTFAAGELEREGESRTVLDRHASHLATLGDDAAEFRSPGAFAEGVRRLGDEVEDIAAAFRHATGVGDALLSLRLASAAALAYNQRLTRLREPRARLEDALEAAAPVPPALEARALSRIVEASWSLGEWERARVAADRAATLFRDLGDELNLANALTWLGPAFANTGSARRGLDLARESVAIYRRHGEVEAAATAEINVANVLIGMGDVSAAAGLLERLSVDDHVTPTHGRVVLVNLALCHVLGGDPDGAESLYCEVIAVVELPAEERVTCYALEGLAAAWVGLGQHLDEAATVLAAVARARNELGAVAELPERRLRERTLASLRASLGDEVFGRALEAGSGMSLRRAASWALAVAETDAASRSRG